MFLKFLFWISAFIIFWANIGYTVSILLINKILKPKQLEKDYSYQPSVTIMIVAHNEEKVIANKMNNVLKLDYPHDKIEILVSSDNSTDNTNDIVKKIILENSERNIRLYEVKERKGKTNAQNEAARTVTSEILVMTDANAIIAKDAIKEIVASFTTKDICYVTGRLCYSNYNDNITSNSENTYWNLDTKIRDIESRLQTITAGNGALYACRTSDYVEINPIKCHDSSMPKYYALKCKRAIANHDAIAYEKAGENVEDEFKRKVRMNRDILNNILPSIKYLNVIKYKWFSYFYFGHRTCRYLLWISHLILLLSSIFLFKSNIIYNLTFFVQIFIYLIALLKKVTKIENKILNMIYYYCVTVLAQWVGVYNIITGKSKPFWEKAESTR